MIQLSVQFNFVLLQKERHYTQQMYECCLILHSVAKIRIYSMKFAFEIFTFTSSTASRLLSGLSFPSATLLIVIIIYWFRKRNSITSVGFVFTCYKDFRLAISLLQYKIWSSLSGINVMKHSWHFLEILL